MEIGGVKPPEGLHGRSLLPLLKSEKSGVIDTTRDWVITGRERHVATAREDNLPYPMRALRKPGWLYIRNFVPDRWPMGAPYSAVGTNSPTQEELEESTYVAFPDMDASPTKAWLVLHRDEPAVKPIFDKAFAKRPAEELYDLSKDPDEMNNVAADPAYAAQKQKLADELMQRLREAGDPRLAADPVFEHPPFTDMGGKAENKTNKQRPGAK